MQGIELVELNFLYPFCHCLFFIRCDAEKYVAKGLIWFALEDFSMARVRVYFEFALMYSSSFWGYPFLIHVVLEPVIEDLLLCF